MVVSDVTQVPTDRELETDGVSATPRSPLLDRPGAVAGEGLDASVALHYGDPMREQRMLDAVTGNNDDRSVGR